MQDALDKESARLGRDGPVSVSAAHVPGPAGLMMMHGDDCVEHSEVSMTGNSHWMSAAHWQER